MPVITPLLVSEPPVPDPLAATPVVAPERTPVFVTTIEALPVLAQFTHEVVDAFSVVLLRTVKHAAEKAGTACTASAKAAIDAAANGWRRNVNGRRVKAMPDERTWVFAFIVGPS